MLVMSFFTNYLYLCVLQVPSGVSTRSDTDVQSCQEGTITFDIADCATITGNNVVASVLALGLQGLCNINCSNNAPCYSIKVLSPKGQSSPPPEQFKCCTAEGKNNNVNCGKQQCSATSTGGSNANAEYYTKCSKSQASVIPLLI